MNKDITNYYYKTPCVIYLEINEKVELAVGRELARRRLGVHVVRLAAVASVLDDVQAQKHDVGRYEREMGG